MASNKNQHFVPRCYLRPFSLDGQGVAINLFNFDRLACIPRAPMKNQCSGDYFYGDDLVLERHLQAMEGAYATTLRQIHTPAYRLDDEHRRQLLDICLLQHMRTEAASLRAVQAINEAEEIAGLPGDRFRFTVREAVQTTMRVFFREAAAIVGDLKVCLVRNVTETPFITSDDPAVMTNRWHLQDSRARGMSPGIGSAGALLLLPLSSDVCCVAYDGSVYSIPSMGGWVTAERAEDIEALNAFQFLNAFANVYFREWDAGDAILAGFRRTQPRRPESRHRIHYAILDREENGAKVYREVNPAEAHPQAGAIIHQELITPIPERWPRLIGWRADGAVYTNGTGTGFVRRATIPLMGGQGYRKLPSRRH